MLALCWDSAQSAAVVIGYGDEADSVSLQGHHTQLIDTFRFRSDIFLAPIQTQKTFSDDFSNDYLVS